METFERTWERAGYWGIVVLPPDKIPASAEYLPYLKGIIDLEEVGQLEAARKGYQQAHLRWKDQELPLLGLGNVNYQLQEYELSIQAFKKLIRLNPQSAQAWNNLSYALTKMDCPKQALDAVKQAILLEPNNKVYRSTLDELVNNRKQHGICQYGGI